MRKKPKKRGLFGLDIFIRYIILIAVAFPGLWIFYTIFTPLTIYPVYFFLKIFFGASLISGNIILVNQSISIEIIKACVAGSAYYLLFVLNMSIPKIKPRRRFNMILFSFGIFLAINLLRIFILSILAISGASFFDITHRLFWYFFSTLFVILIWFAEVKYFKIKEIPFYSDLKFLYKKSSLRK